LNCSKTDRKVKSIEDLKMVLGKKCFFYNNKYYYIQFDEALKIRDLLPCGYFPHFEILSHAESYEVFKAYFEGRIEGQNETFIGSLINYYSNKVGLGNIVLFTKDIKNKNDFVVFGEDGFNNEEKENFIEELSDYLERKIDIDSPKTWLPFLKDKTSCIENFPSLYTIKNDLDHAIFTIYDEMEHYNKLCVCANDIIIKYVSNFGNKNDQVCLAMTIGLYYGSNPKLFEKDFAKEIYDKIVNSWKEFDGFNYDLEN
jgi:hypothetical protein